MLARGHTSRRMSNNQRSNSKSLSASKPLSNKDKIDYIYNNLRSKPRGRRNRRRRNGRNRSFSRMPAAFTSTYKANSRISQIRGAPCLISQEVFPVYASSEAISFMLPMVPTKWENTRSAVLASTYTAYRPIEVAIIFQPIVGTDKQGSVAVGTVFDGAAVNLTTPQAAASSLPATNGGFVTQLYRPMRTFIKLATSLRFNLFPTYDVGEDDIPFWLVASVQSELEDGGLVGNLIVQYKASLKNPSIAPERPTAASSIMAEIVNTTDPDETKLLIDKNLIHNLLAQGRDYLFTFNKTIYNKSDNAILRPLQTMPLNLSEVGQDNYIFDMDPNIKSVSSLLATLIGPSNTGNFQ